MNPVPLALGELRRSAFGSAVVVVLIGLSTSLGLSVTAAERAMRAAANRAADRFAIVVGAPGNPTQLVLTTVYLQQAALELLPRGALRKVADLPGVASVAPVAVTDSFHGYPIVGTEASLVGSQVSEGREFASEHEAVIGHDVALPIGLIFNPQHGAPAQNAIESHEHGFAVAVVGRLPAQGTPWDRAIVLPIGAVLAMHDEELTSPLEARLPALVVTPRTVTDAYIIRSRLRADGMLAVFPAEILLPLYRVLGDAREVFTWMTVVYQAMLAVAIVLLIVAVVSGRRQGIGVLRALGAPGRFVFATVWLQGAVLMVSGVVLGVALAAGFAHALSRFLSARTGVAVHAQLGWPELALVGCGLLAASLLAALPSIFALRVSAARLLRIR